MVVGLVGESFWGQIGVGLVSCRCQEATNECRAVEELSAERTLLEPEVDEGGRS